MSASGNMDIFETSDFLSDWLVDLSGDFKSMLILILSQDGSSQTRDILLSEELSVFVLRQLLTFVNFSMIQCP